MKTVAKVQTQKANRYLKALVNHFSRKIAASYQENQGTIAFGFGNCTIQAKNGSLIIKAESDNADDLERVKQVIDSHLKRFTQDENLTLNWSVVHEKNPA